MSTKLPLLKTCTPLTLHLETLKQVIYLGKKRNADFENIRKS